MQLFKNTSLNKKIIGWGIIMPAILLGLFFAFHGMTVYEDGKEFYLAKARSVCRMAEATRARTEEKWEAGLLTAQQMRELVEAGKADTAMGMVPIVTAMHSVGELAEIDNFELKVPKVNPRNPDNEPDEKELEVLEKFRGNKKLEEYSYIDEEARMIHYFRPVYLSESCLICHGDPANSQEYWGNDEGKDFTGATMENWKAGEMHGAFEIVQSLEPLDATVKEDLTKAGIGVLAGLLAYVLLFLYFTRSWLTRPLKRCVEFAGQIANGDISNQIEVESEDEIGQLSRSLNSMGEHLNSMISGIKTNAKETVQTSDDLKTLSSNMAEASDEVSGQSISVASATEEISTNLNDLAHGSETMTSAVSTVATAVEELNATLSEVAKNCSQASTISDEARGQASQTERVMSELDLSTNQITQVLGSINAIADRINLLAINASIEAASAGEAGRGFAVVANEVKELASQTAQAIETINQQTKQIEGSATSAVEANRKIVEVIEELAGISQTIACAVEEQSATTAEIARSIAGASQDTQTLATGIQEISEGTSQISQNIQNVSGRARETSEGVETIRNSANRLAELSRKLGDAVEFFKTK